MTLLSQAPCAPSMTDLFRQLPATKLHKDGESVTQLDTPRRDAHSDSQTPPSHSAPSQQRNVHPLGAGASNLGVSLDDFLSSAISYPVSSTFRFTQKLATSHLHCYHLGPSHTPLSQRTAKLPTWPPILDLASRFSTHKPE